MNRHQVTQLLHDWQAGKGEALDDLMPLVYDELHRLARHYMKGERSGHTLQTTALVHEAYLKLMGADVDWKDRVHFFAVAATAMRRILVDHARSKGSGKRGGDRTRVPLDEAFDVSPEPAFDLVALDDALVILEKQDQRKGRVVELFYFGGLNYDEIGTALEVSASTIKSEMRFARAFLKSQMEC